MYLHELLPREHVLVPLEATTLTEALGSLVERLVEVGVVREPQEILRLLTTTRLNDIVSIGGRVALLHLRTDLVEDLSVALGVSPTPLSAPEKGAEIEPVIVVLILAPPGVATLYLQAVAALARLFRMPGVVDQIRNARSAGEVVDVPAFRETRIQPRLTVRDIMLHRVPSVSPDTPVREAVDLMVRRQLRALPVVGEKDEVLGVISEWEVMRALLPNIPRAGEGEDGGGRVEIPEDLETRDIMSRSVLCISEEMGVEEAANTMINKDVEQFPVVSEGRLTGFLTRGDIIRKLFGR